MVEFAALSKRRGGIVPHWGHQFIGIEGRIRSSSGVMVAQGVQPRVMVRFHTYETKILSDLNR